MSEGIPDPIERWDNGYPATDERHANVTLHGPANASEHWQVTTYCGWAEDHAAKQHFQVLDEDVARRYYAAVVKKLGG